MLYIINQFIKGIGAYFTSSESQLAEEYLNTGEKDLFLKLSRHERRHAIDTARTIQSYEVKKNSSILIKAALLHDIGKIEGGLGIIKKSLVVVMDKLVPRISSSLSLKINMFNIYYNHPSIGAELLRSIKTDERIVLLVENHHVKGKEYIEGMELLHRADESN